MSSGDGEGKRPPSASLGGFEIRPSRSGAAALGLLGISSVLRAGLKAEEEPGVWAKNEPTDPVLSEAMASGFVKTGPSVEPMLN